MKAGDTKEQGQASSSFQEEATADNQQDETETLHSPSVVDTQPLSAARFFARLRTDLADRGINYNTLPKFTPEGAAPPCYTMRGDDFDLWLAMASHLGAAVTYRADMPAEPNYCLDCQRHFKAQAVAAGKCLFPRVTFEGVRTSETVNGKTIIEYEIVGLSRSKELAIQHAQEASMLEDVE